MSYTNRQATVSLDDLSTHPCQTLIDAHQSMSRAVFEPTMANLEHRIYSSLDIYICSNEE